MYTCILYTCMHVNTRVYIRYMHTCIHASGPHQHILPTHQTIQLPPSYHPPPRPSTPLSHQAKIALYRASCGIIIAIIVPPKNHADLPAWSPSRYDDVRYGNLSPVSLPENHTKTPVK